MCAAYMKKTQCRSIYTFAVLTAVLQPPMKFVNILSNSLVRRDVITSGFFCDHFQTRAVYGEILGYNGQFHHTRLLFQNDHKIHV